MSTLPPVPLANESFGHYLHRVMQECGGDSLLRSAAAEQFRAHRQREAHDAEAASRLADAAIRRAYYTARRVVRSQ